MEDLAAYLTYSDPVKEALANGYPIVALESTIISHGMPYPQNIQTAKDVEKQVIDAGAVPATCAVIGGKIHVGLDDVALGQLAKAGRSARKCSRRDLAVSVARKEMGGTTVAATMIIAKMAGIKVFVTGGIGGVHRGAEVSFDVSADLTELGRTAVTVVCAGVKSILDIQKTLEVLETQGTTVIGYGTDEFPAFFTTKSGCSAPLRSDTPQDVAAIINANTMLGLGSGILVAVPVPAEEEANHEGVQAAITKALAEATEQGVTGKDVTPFLLQRVNELSQVGCIFQWGAEM